MYVYEYVYVYGLFTSCFQSKQRLQISLKKGTHSCDVSLHSITLHQGSLDCLCPLSSESEIASDSIAKCPSTIYGIGTADSARGSPVSPAAMAPKDCRNGCGFFGRDEWEGLCSSCWKQTQVFGDCVTCETARARTINFGSAGPSGRERQVGD